MYHGVSEHINVELLWVDDDHLLLSPATGSMRVSAELTC
jgi:hypothetical protein